MQRRSHSQPSRRILSALSLCLVLLAAAPAHAQQTGDPDILLDVYPGAVFPNQRVNLVLRVSGTQLTSAPEAPRAKGATLRKAQSGRSKINGKTYLTFLYTLIANQPGTVEISPFTLQTSNGEIRTQPYSFTVLDDAPLLAAENAGKKAFVIPTVPSRSFYQRESFIANLTLFFDPRVDVASNTIPEFESQGYSVNPTGNNYNGQILIDGSTFNYVSYPVEITPVQAGTLLIGSPTMDMMAYERGRTNSIFSTRQGVAFSADGIDATFEVKPLPTPPAGFSGAVGSYKMNVTLPTVPTTTGDPVEVEIQIKGTGKEEFVGAPMLDDPEEKWRIYDMGESRTVAEDGTITFNKVLRPTKPTNKIPPFIFTYFDPNKERYVSLESEPDELPWNLANFPTNNKAGATDSPPSTTPSEAQISFPSLESPQWIGNSSSEIDLKAINLVGGGITCLALIALLISKSSQRARKNNQVRELIRVVSKSSNSLQQRLHALLEARSLLHPDHALEGDWKTLAEIHDKLSYAPERTSDPGSEDITRAEKLLPEALQTLREQEATMLDSSVRPSTTAALLLCCAMLTQYAGATEPEIREQLDTAKQAIAEQDWITASEALSTLHEHGKYSPETLLAEGACYLKRHDYAKAKASFAQALASDISLWSEIQRNLELIDTPPTSEEYIRQLGLVAIPRTPLIASLCVAFWLCVFLFITRRALKRRRLTNVLLGILCILFLALAASIIYLQTVPDSKSVVVLTEYETLRDVPLNPSATGTPNDDAVKGVAMSASGATIRGGELAIALETSGEFILLQQLEEPQNRGWVKKENVVPMNPIDTNTPLDR